MSALAILIRTDAYHRVQSASDSSYWHISASEVGYQGSALVIEHSIIDKSVDGTKHLILLHPNQGQDLPFATAWTENSAGKTAPYAAIFRKDLHAIQKGVEAPHAALVRKDSKWTYQVSKKTLAQLLNLKQIQSLELFVDPFSAKVYGVRIQDGTKHHDIDFLALQNKLGSRHLQSSDFTFTVKEDQIMFTGFGKGHGVGLCLYSAGALAQNGENAVQILSKFFPETYLYNLNAVIK